MYEALLYIAFFCGITFYAIELIALKDTYLLLHDINVISNNKIMNYYSMRLRCCGVVFSTCTLIYSQKNTMFYVVVEYSVFLSFDILILCIRLYYAYILHRLERTYIEINEIKNPLNNL